MVQYYRGQIIYSSNIENYSDISYNKIFKSDLYRSVRTYYIFMSFTNDGQFNSGFYENENFTSIVEF